MLGGRRVTSYHWPLAMISLAVSEKECKYWGVDEVDRKWCVQMCTAYSIYLYIERERDKERCKKTKLQTLQCIASSPRSFFAKLGWRSNTFVSGELGCGRRSGTYKFTCHKSARNKGGECRGSFVSRECTDRAYSLSLSLKPFN